MAWRNPLRTGAVVMSLITMSGTAVLSANRASAEPGEPAAASIVWTSDDPVVVEARKLINQGQLTEAEKLLKRDDPSASEDAKIARQELSTFSKPRRVGQPGWVTATRPLRSHTSPMAARSRASKAP